ncbi:hypothetical protein [Planococcus salinus]|uniref:Citrate transporter-like domain-containing protein n=1 Tax=Planococcus salinus TaxID=1848460 RepID=A0A3M8P7U8_9BACL|nr:hypothetical protein [Planococcus salinus]RNF39768.1 hypothetical protein EEX84_07315 [Planococcus salinus]
MKPVIRPASTLLMGSTYLASQYFPIPFADLLICLFALVVLVSYFPYLNRTGKILISTLTAGALLMDFSREGLQQFFFGLDTNSNILAIFIFVPLLAIPIQQGQYLKYIEIIFSFYIKRTHQLYLFTITAMASIGSVMNLGTIPILYQLTDTRTFQPFDTVRIKALTRGYVLSFMWSPYFISIGLVISYFDVSWMQLFPIGIILVILSVVVGYLIEGKHTAEIADDFEKPDRAALKAANRKVLELVLIISAVTAVIMVIESLTELSVLAIIPVIAIAASAIWTSLISTKQQFTSHIRSFFTGKLPSMGNELSVFIIAGAFGTALLANGADRGIMYLLETFNITHVLMLIPLILVLMTIPAIIGVHPIVSAAILSITLSQSPAFLEDHLYLAVGFLASWMVAILVSPFSGLNLIMAAITRKSPFEIALKMNLGFSLLLWMICYAATGMLYFFGNFTGIN